MPCVVVIVVEESQESQWGPVSFLGGIPLTFIEWTNKGKSKMHVVLESLTNRL